MSLINKSKIKELAELKVSEEFLEELEKEIERIIKKAEKAGKAGLTTTQVITAVKGKSLDTLLIDINNIDGILGSIIVSKDGLVIANTMPDNIDKDLIGALTSSLFSNIDVQVKKLSKGTLKRLTVETDLGIFVLTEIEMGTLVVLSKDKSKPNLSETFKAIATVTGKR
jgi:predicted regulator of Ras-like GTPase activity (Roadblock/LC7/MglB family)